MQVGQHCNCVEVLWGRWGGVLSTQRKTLLEGIGDSAHSGASTVMDLTKYFC